MKVCIALLTKNCAPYLPRVLKNVEAYASCFSSSHVWIVDGYSTDLTGVICNSWCKSSPQTRFFLHQPSNHLPRGESLTEARNYVLELTRSYWEEGTYLLLLDADSPNAVPLNIEGFQTCFSREDWDACFVNQQGEYYDLWALRDDQLTEDYQIKFRHLSWGNGSMQSALKPYQQPKRGTDGSFYPVKSAFGGAGLYKTWSIPSHARYECTTICTIDGQPYKVPVCEHVPFHEAFVHAKLVINTTWVNGDHK